jgi:four helix bundle protein
MENQQPGKSQNPIRTKSFTFALSIIDYPEILEANRKFVLANQLLKSGTSIGANVWEAQHAESRADFIHKLKIAAKEAEETAYWLQLWKHSKNYEDPGLLLPHLAELQKLLSGILSSAKKAQQERKNRE